MPALTLQRRKARTEPFHCIDNLGLGVVAQGDKQVLLGGEAIDYGLGQSMLTTIDLPVEALDAALLDALVRLVNLLDEPTRSPPSCNR